MEYRMLTETRTPEAKEIRRKMRKQGKDWSPRRSKILIPRKDHLANTLTTLKEDVNRLVLVIPKSTDMRIPSTEGILKDTKIMKTLEISIRKNWQILICWLEDSLAKLSQSLEDVAVLMTQEVRSSLKSLGLLKKNAHAFYCLKTLKGCYLTTKEKPLEQSLIRWMNWGMTSNGKCLTARFGFPKTEREYSLSDILEEQVDQKYFLSREITEKVLKNLRAELMKQAESIQ